MTILLQNVLQIQHNFYQTLNCFFAERDKLNLKFISARDLEWPKQSWKRKELKNSGIPVSKLKRVCAQSTQLYPTLCNPLDCSLPGSSVHEIILAIILEWVAISSSSGSSQSKDQTCISCIFCIGRFFTTSATWKVHYCWIACLHAVASVMSESLWPYGL